MSMLNHMTQLVDLFSKRCSDRSTLGELREMIDAEDTWHQAHDLFSRIRDKTLRAETGKDEQANCQYLFEEVCAQSLYNLTDTDAPFDADSPYWIVPNALSLARRLGIPELEIARIVAG